MSQRPEHELGPPILVVAGTVAVRAEKEAGRVWVTDETGSLPPLLMRAEPQVFPLNGQPPSLVLAGLLESGGGEACTVDISLEGGERRIVAQVSEGVWIAPLPLDAFDDHGAVTGSLTAYDAQGTALSEHKLRDLVALSGESEVGGWTAYGGTAA
jgi:hypothetical protein